MTASTHRRVRPLAALAIATAIAASAIAGATPAWASAGVSVAGPDGGSLLPADYATEVTVSGTGFQSIAKGFGGVYVLFGWVDDAAGGSWRPSQGGEVGSDYRYVPDAESADNAGYQRFLAFPGSQTESSANGVLGADGSWSLSMVVPGAVFESQDRDGRVSEVDCRQVTCGIITIGAHGVKNANNETFTPVSFGTAPAAAEGGTDAAPAAPAAPAGSVRVGLASGFVEAGTSIVFTGQGFTPGEQVVASLDSGLTAVGPLTAGSLGEVAGALPVPSDARDGTHLVSLRGAGSGVVAEAEVTVTGSTAAAGLVSAATTETPQWVVVVLLASIVLASVLIVTSLIAGLRRRHRRNKARRAAAAVPVAEASTDAPTAAASAPVVPSTTPMEVVR
jgi:hypothetical protein